ncbi:MAG TPA: hypothetical protein DDZ24_00735, partial [Planctomycetaceae bacterium]|nr:hypothetical protein [Planctomycetaceae bacterium]
EAADQHDSNRPLVLERLQNLFASQHAPQNTPESLASMLLLPIPDSVIAAVLPVLTFCLSVRFQDL